MKDTTMSHKNLNPVNAASPKRVAIVISNPAVSTTTGWPVGFWWSELSHPYYRFTELGYHVEIFSPDGGACVGRCFAAARGARARPGAADGRAAGGGR